MNNQTNCRNYLGKNEENMDLSHIHLAVYGAYSCTKRWKNNLKSLIIAIFYALSYSKKM